MFTKKLLFSLTLLLFSFSLSFGQSTSGTITGRITDEQGAALLGANVTVYSPDLELTRQITTDNQGYYRITGLPFGRYQVKAEQTGFMTELKINIAVSVAQESIVDLSLPIGEVTEILTIQSDTSVIERNNSTLSGLVNEKTIRSLPLNGRDISQLVLLQPGVVASRSSVTSANNGRGTQFSVSGSRPNQNLFVLDGTTINDALNTTPGNAQGLLLGVETIKEFRVLTNTYGAEYGRSSGGVFVAATKSGSNQFHGSIFNFLRNDTLDARNFFDKEKPEFRRNQFGATVGGAIIKNRTFFFGSYEGLREFKGISRVSIVPDDQARLGVLPGQSVIKVDSRSQPLINLFPRANGNNLGDGTAEFTGTTNRVARNDFFTIRFDHNLSKSDVFDCTLFI
ncbi:MAG: TonB-dependent receptor [Blastocatellia bacterium]|nr:TonB-dependent receptor [Blastocatellia bacterium]